MAGKPRSAGRSGPFRPRRWALLLLLVAALAVASDLFLPAGFFPPHEHRVVMVMRGQNLRGIASELKRVGLLRGTLSFLVAAANGWLCDLVFHRNGAPLREFRKSWARACKKAGVRRLFHDLRRSAVRDMTRAGVSQNVAMSISGHKTIAMFKRYDIVDVSDQRQALQRTQEYRKVAKDNVIALAAK